MNVLFRRPQLLLEKLQNLRETFSFSFNRDDVPEGNGIELETFSSFSSVSPPPPPPAVSKPEKTPVRSAVSLGLPPAPPRVKPKPADASPVEVEQEDGEGAAKPNQPNAPSTPEQAPVVPQLRLDTLELGSTEDSPVVSEELGSSGLSIEEPQVLENRAKDVDDPWQEYLSRLVNQRLRGDEALSGVLPLNTRSCDLLEACKDGVLPCKFLNTFIEEAADERALNIPDGGNPLTGSEKRQNHRLCLNSLKALDRVSMIDPRKLADGEEETIMKLLWQILRVGLLQDIDVRRMRELRILQEENEDIFDLLQLTSEELLLRWINFRLETMEEHHSIPPVRNFEEDLNDCMVYLLLQKCAAPELFADIEISNLDAHQRAAKVLSNCDTLGIDSAHTPAELLQGDKQLSLILIAHLFWYDHGLMISDTEDVESDEEQYQEHEEGSREERAFRMWMNSLGCDMTCMNLFSEDIRSGWLLLEVLDAIQPGCVNWKLSFKPPFKAVVRRIKAVENCNQVIDIAKNVLKASLVGLGGDDIADGKRKPILALVWQLMRIHTLQVLRSAAGGNATGALSESDVLTWANQILTLQKSAHTIPSFRDPGLATGHAVLDLLKAIEPSAVQKSHIHPGVTEMQREMNAKYIISIARKLGATIFVVWEDVVEVKPKIMFVLIASLMLLEKQRRRIQRGQNSLSRRTGETRSAARQDSYPRDYIPPSPRDLPSKFSGDLMLMSPRDYCMPPPTVGK